MATDGPHPASGDGTGPDAPQGDAPTGPLAGVLVADFSRVLAGPLATMLLADMGAEVVKIEQPGRGDESREWGPPFLGPKLSSYYASVNRNKSSVALDLRDPADHAQALALARRADVVIENFRPGTMERLGLGYDRIAERNPEVVYCAISAFGRGSGADLPGYDFLLQATGGLMSITGDPDGPPTKVGVALVDVITGLYATIGVLGALREREQHSGRGQRVDVSLLSAVLAALVNQASAFVTTGQVPGRMGNAHPSVVPYELFDTADEPLVLAVGNDRHFVALAEQLGDPELATDSRFSTNRARVENVDQLRARIDAALAARSRDDWIARLRAAGVACGPVNDVGQAFALAEDLGLAPVVTIKRPGGDVPQVANPLTFSRTPVSYRSAPPDLGEHTEALSEMLADMTERSARTDRTRHRT